VPSAFLFCGGSWPVSCGTPTFASRVDSPFETLLCRVVLTQARLPACFPLPPSCKACAAGAQYFLARRFSPSVLLSY